MRMFFCCFVAVAARCGVRWTWGMGGIVLFMAALDTHMKHLCLGWTVLMYNTTHNTAS